MPPCRYEPEENWERQLHDIFGISWPCESTCEFWALWPIVLAVLKAQGVQAGPRSFDWWNDGDAGLVRAIWCLVRHLRPKNVLETGVGHGLTSRFIIEALEKNGVGHLWSIDLPPLNPQWWGQIGMAVDQKHPHRWSFIRGSSRRHLSSVLSELGQVDLFVHDSLHSKRNVRFELDSVWACLRPGGVLVVDDVDVNWGFRSFGETFHDCWSIICEAEPLHPDVRRFNKKGLFGIIVKKPFTGIGTVS